MISITVTLRISSELRMPAATLILFILFILSYRNKNDFRCICTYLHTYMLVHIVFECNKYSPVIVFLNSSAKYGII